ncbi:MAG: GerMN domain-containing protein [Geobacteraceae bacterium]|nr:GerMN domain-containing protein [Geobacteraceae bacterium]
MNKIFHTAMALTVLLLLFSTVSCSKKESPPPQETRVSATKAYEKFFGPAPTTDKGTCFAFVIYFPSARTPGKVVPFPFFTFDEGSIKKVAVERLLSGMDLPAYRGEFLLPFHSDTRLLGLTEDKGSVSLNFNKDFINIKGDKTSEQGVLKALALTLSQFNGVKEVRIAVEGKEGAISLPSGGQIHNPLVVDERSVLEPGPSRLLEVAGLKEKGTKTIEGVHVYFDRPVDVKDLSLADHNGKPFAGEIFHSVFDMAAVLKPKDPSLFTAGMPVKISWKVADKKGRSAEGKTVLPLVIKEH